MLGPTTRAVENLGSSTVNVAGSRSTSTAAAQPVTRKASSAGTHATGDCARSAREVRVRIALQVVDRQGSVNARSGCLLFGFTLPGTAH